MLRNINIKKDWLVGVKFCGWVVLRAFVGLNSVCYIFWIIIFADKTKDKLLVK